MSVVLYFKPLLLLYSFVTCRSFYYYADQNTQIRRYGFFNAGQLDKSQTYAARLYYFQKVE